MKVLGIDPGSIVTGYGVVEEIKRKLVAAAWGKIRPPKDASLAVRLKVIHQGIEDVIDKHNPDVVVVEDLFYAENVKSAFKLAHARAVAILAAAKQDIQVEEYSPLEIKQSVVGYGRADKKQIKTMVSYLLNLGDNPKTSDESDALAVAICHLNSARMKRKLAV